MPQDLGDNLDMDIVPHQLRRGGMSEGVIANLFPADLGDQAGPDP